MRRPTSFDQRNNRRPLSHSHAAHIAQDTTISHSSRWPEPSSPDSRCSDVTSFPPAPNNPGPLIDSALVNSPHFASPQKQECNDNAQSNESPSRRRMGRISSGSSPEKAETAPNLLLKLLEACAKHKRRHERHPSEPNDPTSSSAPSPANDEGNKANNNLKKCWKDLHSLSRVLPRVESCIVVEDTQHDHYQLVQVCENVDEIRNEQEGGRDNYVKERKRQKKMTQKENLNELLVRDNEADDVRHLCALYRAIARGAFCPHASYYLFGGGATKMNESTGKEKHEPMHFHADDFVTVKDTLPRITQLLKCLASDPERVALLGLGKSSVDDAEKPNEMTVDDALRTYRSEEDIGATIAALLNLLLDEGLRLAAVRDLMNLSRDLCVIDESRVLFDPSLSSLQKETKLNSVEKEKENQTQQEGKVRVRIFTEVMSTCQRMFNSNGRSIFVFDNILGVSSRRSLLALQLGAWSALYQFMPLLNSDHSYRPLCEEGHISRSVPTLVGDNEMKSSSMMHISGQIRQRVLLASLASFARQVLLLPTCPNFLESRFSAWQYSHFDFTIHSILLLRTKLFILSLLMKLFLLEGDASVQDGIANIPLSKGAFGGISQTCGVNFQLSVDLAVLAVEASKSHLSSFQTCSGRSIDNNALERGDSSFEFPTKLECQLNLWYLWGLSKFVLSCVLFPDHAPSAKNDIWLHTLPYIVDCIPCISNLSITDRPEIEKCLSQVIIRVIHVIISENMQIVSGLPMQQTWATVSTRLVDFIRNRCLTRGYFAYLFKMTSDSLESISAPAVSIITCLFKSHSSPRGIGRESPRISIHKGDFIEAVCLTALNIFDPDKSNDGKAQSLNAKNSLFDETEGKVSYHIQSANYFYEKSNLCDASVVSVFSRNILFALRESQIIIRKIKHDNTPCSENTGEIKQSSLKSCLNLSVFGSIAGTLSILLALHGKKYEDICAYRATTKVIQYLLQCFRCVSDLILRQKDCDNLHAAELEHLRSSITVIVSVGLRACEISKEFGGQSLFPCFEAETKATSSEARVADVLGLDVTFQCAIAALPIICRGSSPKPKNVESEAKSSNFKKTRYCRNICHHICSLIGVHASPYPGICMCRLIAETSSRLADKYFSLTFSSIFPLEYRCILLASLLPVISDSREKVPTLSLLSDILINPVPKQSSSQPYFLVTSSLLGLPNLFTALATRVNGSSACRANQLVSMMDSFNSQELLLRHASSKNQSIKCAALLTLTHLSKIYATASMVLSTTNKIQNQQDSFCQTLSHVWNEINTSSYHFYLASPNLTTIEKCLSSEIFREVQFHPALGSVLFSEDKSNLFDLSDCSLPQCQMAKYLYLWHISMLAPLSAFANLRAFFQNDSHYAILNKLAGGGVGVGAESAAVSIPNPVWLLLAPFVARDTQVRTFAAKLIGRVLLGNGCKIFSAFFAPDNEMSLAEQSNKGTQSAVKALFLEIDFLLSIFCHINRNLLCSKFQDDDDAKSFHDSNKLRYTEVPNMTTAIFVLRSLCENSPLQTKIGISIFQRSLLGLVRIWVACSGKINCGGSEAFDLPTTSSLASVAFDGLWCIFRGGRESVFSTSDPSEHLHSILPNLFSEFFLPSSHETIGPRSRYRLLTVFIESFLLSPSSRHGLPMRVGLDVSNVVEVIGLIDRAYPSIIARLIVEQDYVALQMCAAYRMYLISEAKKLGKEEKRIQKRNTDGIPLRPQIGKHRPSPSRSLVPGVTISTKKLIENTKLLCVKSDVIEHVLPQLLLHSGRAPLKFFTSKICQSEVNLSEILREKDLSVLKTLVWELGADDPEEDERHEMYDDSLTETYLKRKDVVLALTKGYLLKERNLSSDSKNLQVFTSEEIAYDDISCSSGNHSASQWVSPNFMYLLVNVVLHKWNTRSDRDKFQAIKCLRVMLRFLPPEDSPQYMPQLMSAISNAMSSPESVRTGNHCQHSQLRLIAVATLFDFVKIVMSYDASSVGENLTSITVTLFPLFDVNDHDGNNFGFARKMAVDMLEWLAGGAASEKLLPYFSEIPFLPQTPDLEKVRNILFGKGIHLDDTRLLSQKDKNSNTTFGASQNCEVNISVADDPLLQSKFYARMNILSRLVLSHESKNVRKVVVSYMSDLLSANRGLFQNLVENEGFASMRFLTIVHDTGLEKDELNCSSNVACVTLDDETSMTGGLVTRLLMRLLSRCIDEPDYDVRDAIASCLGEIGAIDPNRLGNEINSSHVMNDSLVNRENNEWRLSQPPWRSQVTRYQLRLLTKHLVSGLKAAPTTLDQHKISFAIQELLKLLDTFANNAGHTRSGSNGQDSSLNGKNPMNLWLKKKLEEEDVNNIVEPFWSTNYKQIDTMAAKLPPFFTKSNSYFSWLSSFCRFLVTRSNSNKRSIWRDFFYSCRSAIRSQAGISVAEFLFPLLILDGICFGDKHDEDVIVNEILDGLSFTNDGRRKTESVMSLREREKAANAIFTVMDVLRHWEENETEQRYRSLGSRSKRLQCQSNSGGGVKTPYSWPVEESITRIEEIMARIPFSSCAIAASKVGMHARALRFLEIESRRSGAAARRSSAEDREKGLSRNGPEYLESHYLDGIDLQLAQTLLGQLNDFDTMAVLGQKNHRAELSRRLTNEAIEREMYNDWEGALQIYEQLLDSRLNSDDRNESNELTGFNKENAQKGLLRSLLKLGRLESVLNQAYGMSRQGSVKGLVNDFLPFATEAAWRLGKWSILDKIVNSLNEKSSLGAESRYQILLGRTIHSLQSNSPERVSSLLKEARESVISSLSSAARESYTRSYPFLMQLHVLREVEYTNSILFTNQPQTKKSFSDFVSSDEWRERLNLTTPDITGSNAIINTRLALSRMADEPGIVGIMWLEIGKMARKGGLYQVAEQSLTQADASFCKCLAGNQSRGASNFSSMRESVGAVKLQFAKLKHAIGESTTALKLIEEGAPAFVLQMNGEELETFVSSLRCGIPTHSNHAISESGEAIGRRILQATEWLVDGGLKNVAEIKRRYSTVLKLTPNWERAHFHFAKYLDFLLESRISALCEIQPINGESKNNRIAVVRDDELCHKYLIDSTGHYGIALQLGQKHVYQALPRLLALWLEFTSIEVGQIFKEDGIHERVDQNAERLLENQEIINNLVKSFINKISEHLFYTALPQLLSCVVHNNSETSKNVVLILRTVLVKYPGQTMWSCGCLRFSKSRAKNTAGEEIFFGAQKLLHQSDRGKQMQAMLHASKSLFKFLIKLAQFSPKDNTPSVKINIPKFGVELKDFIPPVQAALSVTPAALGRLAGKDVFPPFVPRMRQFNPELKIMASKAKPKKVSIFAVPPALAQRGPLPDQGHAIAQDAGEMHFLLKQEAKGDLRKDSRVQDLNNVINRIFAGRKGSAGANSHRQRLRLHLRTFSVVCLTEDCGILEWVPNTDSFRNLVSKTYNPLVAPDSIYRRGSRLTNFADPNLRNTFMKCQELFFKKGNLILAGRQFNQYVLKEFPPVLYWWFIQNFSNPHAWFEARANFTLSAAVWSAVGHMIGLGDRHSENILIDTRSGECVHVDFDCIFDKGLNLPRPEVIPFRLTPNMLDAFGPAGAEGLFNGALIESMSTLRKNRDTLLSVLEPFLKDPVINFQSSKSQQKSSGEKDVKSAKRSIKIIDGRLRGTYNLRNPNLKKVRRQDGFSPNEEDEMSHLTQFSVEGQVQKMIMEATSHENLVQLYVGWMPWI